MKVTTRAAHADRIEHVVEPPSVGGVLGERRRQRGPETLRQPVELLELSLAALEVLVEGCGVGHGSPLSSPWSAPLSVDSVMLRF
jgi:hypothetical protein